MIRLVLVRHGQTNANLEQRYQGQTSVSLNAIGRAQARQLADRFRQHAIDEIIASDLRRAMQTAQTIAAPHNMAVEPDVRLREMAFGDWEGLTWGEIQARWPERVAAWLENPLNVAPPAGETLQQVAVRVQDFCQDVMRRKDDLAIMVVSHGGPLRVLLCLALGLSVREHWRFKLDVASVSQIEMYNDTAVLTLLNDSNHCA